MIATQCLDGVFLVTLDNPKVNAIGAKMSRQMGETFDRFAADSSLKVAILYGGEGKVFSAGWDLKSVALEGLDEQADYGSGGFGGLTERFELDKPVIAAINGAAIGAGFELALACDLIVAARRATFALPETALGVMADAGGVQRLSRKLPANLAMEMLLTGRILSASEGHHFGIVNHVVDDADVLDRSMEIARKIVESAPIAVRAIKAAASATAHLPLPAAFSAIRALPIYKQMLASPDHDEGPRAFAEKRKPRWSDT